MSQAEYVGETVRVAVEGLRSTVEAIFSKRGLPREEAAMVADALVESDLMGVSSHGVSNYIQLIYMPGLDRGSINPTPNIEVLRESPVSALIDGDGGMGHVIGTRAMKLAIEKAQTSGMAAVAVKNSRHYGMAGHYSRMAIEHDMIGFSVTNSDKLVTPTFGRDAVLGTNPIAFSVPTSSQAPFHLDMATSTVPFGKIMLAARAGKEIPFGWAADSEGQPTSDPQAALEAYRLLPLGSTYELGGHKGYGLGAAVDILSGLLSGAGAGLDDELGTAVGHFFGAMRIDLFQDAREFKEKMDGFLERLVSTIPVEGEEGVIYAGVLEAECRADRVEKGIPLNPKVITYLEDLCKELGVDAEI